VKKTRQRNIGIVAGLAFVAVAVGAGIFAGAAAFDDGEEKRAEAPRATPTTVVTVRLEDALADFVTDHFGVSYAGVCPQNGDLPDGICSVEISRTAGEAKFGLGRPYSEVDGIATLTRQADGSWDVHFEPA
jgi:hypothetical protein